jgi:hypothetical protein
MEADIQLEFKIGKGFFSIFFPRDISPILPEIGPDFSTAIASAQSLRVTNDQDVNLGFSQLIFLAHPQETADGSRILNGLFVCLDFGDVCMMSSKILWIIVDQ